MKLIITYTKTNKVMKLMRLFYFTSLYNKNQHHEM